LLNVLLEGERASITHQHSSWSSLWASLLAEQPEELGVNMLLVGEGENIQ
jgi:hypothetical protein